MNEDFSHLKLKDYDRWSVSLHSDQRHVGRVVLWCNRDDALDFIDMTEEEKEEFFVVAGEVKRALTVIFKPDMFNYAALGNVTRHLHVHLVPRYASERKVKDHCFKDEQWGRNYTTERTDRIPAEIIQVIRKMLRNELDKEHTL